MLHHDIRASLFYSCQTCMHPWQIDPAEEQPAEVLESHGRTGAAMPRFWE